MDFVAIDFETANEARNSACELGLTYFSGGSIIVKKEWLIRPPELRFNPINTEIHGISARDVRNKPEFDVLWPEIGPWFSGRLVVAHNASFDMSVLRALMDYYRIPYPETQYACSVVMAKKAWPGLERYGLHSLSQRFDISLDHHRALSDAIACGMISQRVFHEYDITAMEHLEPKLQFTLGKLYPGGYQASSVKKPAGMGRKSGKVSVTKI